MYLLEKGHFYRSAATNNGVCLSGGVQGKGRLNADRRTLCETLVRMNAKYAKEQECLTDVVKL